MPHGARADAVSVRTAICYVPRPLLAVRRLESARLRVVVFFVVAAAFVVRVDPADFGVDALAVR